MSQTQVKRKILVDLRLGRFNVGRFWFYIIKSCPETLVIGTKTLGALEAQLEWKTRTLTIKVGRNWCRMPWSNTTEPYWRHPILLKAKSTHRLPSCTMTCVELEDVSEEVWRNWTTKEGVYTPLRTERRLKQRFMTAYGFGPFRTKVMLYTER